MQQAALKKYHIKTWGCQMNTYDSGRIGEILQTVGYENTDDVTEAELVILNTCHIREKATEKVFSDIGRLKKIKDRRKLIGLNLIIGVAGCVAQAEGAQILKRSKDVDFVLGSQMWNELPEILEKIENKGGNNKVFESDAFDENFLELLAHVKIKFSST